MEFRDFINKIGVKFTISNGELVELNTGEFVVSTNLNEYTIYLNKLTQTAAVIAPRSCYIGRQYTPRNSDCANLFAEWLDNNYGTKYIDYYSKVRSREFYKYYKSGMRQWFLDQKFTEHISSEIQVGDCLIYKNDNEILRHVGVCTQPGKILHHIPAKLSSIDDINLDSVLGVYRYVRN